MASVESTKKALATNGQELVPADPLAKLLGRLDIKKRFEDILGKKAPGFISSIMSVVNSKTELKGVDPMSTLASAVVAATLDLPINPNLGFAYIVPYKGSAQFQMGYKGFIQLAIRSGQYETIHASDVYEDELKFWNPITGEFALTDKDTWKQREAGEINKVVGYVAFFKLLNGFRKYLYMTTPQITKHAQKYSQSFGSNFGRWKLDFPVMALKTVIKLLLSKYGILSIEMQRALDVDQAVVSGIDPDKQTLNYQDAEISEPMKTEAPAPLTNGAAGAEPEIPFGSPKGDL